MKQILKENYQLILLFLAMLGAQHAQTVSLRTDMRSHISELRTDIRTQNTELRTDMRIMSDKISDNTTEIAEIKAQMVAVNIRLSHIETKLGIPDVIDDPSVATN